MIDTEIVITLFVIVQVELLIMITLIIILLVDEHKKRQNRPDPLLKHVKEYLAEGYSMHQTQEKLKKLGFSEERIEKITHDFMNHH